VVEYHCGLQTSKETSASGRNISIVIPVRRQNQSSTISLEKKISGDKDYLVPKLNEKQLCLCTTYKTMKTDNILNKNVFMSPDNILTLHPKMTNATSTIRLQKS